MNYEIFHDEYQTLSDVLKTQLASQLKLLRRINSRIEIGDVKTAAKDADALLDTIKNGTDSAMKAADFVKSLDMSQYVSSGEFAEQLVVECNASGIDIVGEDTSFEVFPYRLKLDTQNTELLINGRKASGLRPKAIAANLSKGREKLLSGSFNPSVFLEELADAYDLAIIASAKGKPISPDQDIYLTTIYKYLTPMRRFRRDYDVRNFAFDLSRLYSHQGTQISDGRNFQFGPSRQNNRAIRIVDETGAERFLATIRFFCKPSL